MEAQVTVRRLVPDEIVVRKYAGILARPALRQLAEDAEKYPASYSRERVMEEADRILDEALDEAAAGVAKFPASAMPDCVVCDDRPGGCEFCPKA